MIKIKDNESDIIATCADLTGIRNWVKQKFGFEYTDRGNFWLPLVLTARGVIYAEVITKLEGKYHQPYHLKDDRRQPLYRLGLQLLDYVRASPAVYLLQFDYDSTDDSAKTILFDRLIPFPDHPAIASVGVQKPDLYECHLLCTTNQPIYDLVIKAQD
jgi:hypothetical protein